MKSKIDNRGNDIRLLIFMDLKYFTDNGFVRNQCVKCGSFFWSKEKREVCSENPCMPYSFSNNPPTKKAYSIDEMRSEFIEFFKRHNHTYIKRYPVVARWRDDVFFTQASIYDFQPWVTKGIIDPPANPLVISQPCLRFNDLNEVGYSGRHFTFFEMMAHHVFNTEKEQIYYKDKTVELCHAFLTQDLGIDEKEISYKEEWWEGGGNAGNSLSVGVRGLEVATLVFMEFIKDKDNLIPMPIKVVDTGYGLERLTWISNGGNTAYDIVFKEYLSGYENLLGKMKESNQNLYYILADHTRSLIYMLYDGVVPSNVKEGYFARLLIRRMINAINKINPSCSLKEVMKVGIAIESKKEDFKSFEKEILDMIEYETHRYNETLKKGKTIIKKIEDNLKKEGKGFDADTLVMLYESNGLHPDIVKEIATIPVNIPDNFFELVSKKNEEHVNNTKNEVINLPDTKILYYNNPYVMDFTSKIVAIHGDAVVLDETYFYPTGGGQITDVGYINGHEVFDVERYGKSVLHHLKGDINEFHVGEVAKCVINKERRLRLMRHHTGAHLINGAARRILGRHIWQAGAFKGVDNARIDLTHYKPLTDKEIKDIEGLANKIIFSAIKIDSKFMERTLAEEKYGFSIYQGGAVPGKTLRIIDIEGFDVEACGGTHCTNTSEVTLIKITNVKRLQDGIVRIEYCCGDLAYEKFIEEENYLKEIAHVLDANESQLLNKITTIKENLEKVHQDYNEKSKLIETQIVEGIEKSAISIGKSRLYVYDFEDEVNIKKMLKNFTLLDYTVALFGNKNTIYIAQSYNNNIDFKKLEETKNRWKLTGGGGKTIVSYLIPDENMPKKKEIFDDFIHTLQSLMGNA